MQISQIAKNLTIGRRKDNRTRKQKPGSQKRKRIDGTADAGQEYPPESWLILAGKPQRTTHTDTF